MPGVPRLLIALTARTSKFHWKNVQCISILILFGYIEKKERNIYSFWKVVHLFNILMFKCTLYKLIFILQVSLYSEVYGTWNTVELTIYTRVLYFVLLLYINEIVIYIAEHSLATPITSVSTQGWVSSHWGLEVPDVMDRNHPAPVWPLHYPWDLWINHAVKHKLYCRTLPGNFHIKCWHSG